MAFVFVAGHKRVTLSAAAMAPPLKKHLLVQGLDTATASIPDLVDFCKRLKCTKEIYTGGANPSNKKNKGR